MRIEKIAKGGTTYEVRLHPAGTKIWRQNNLAHREDGPAVEYSDGSFEWLFNEEHHNENGCAIKHSSGKKEYRLCDELISRKIHQKKVKEINKFYETCSIGDVLQGNLILLGKRNIPAGKFFNVYNIQKKEIREELTYVLFQHNREFNSHQGNP